MIFFLIKLEKDFGEIALFSVHIWQNDKEKQCNNAVPKYTSQLLFSCVTWAQLDSTAETSDYLLSSPAAPQKQGTVHAISSDNIQQSARSIRMLPEKITPLLCESTGLLLMRT